MIIVIIFKIITRSINHNNDNGNNNNNNNDNNTATDHYSKLTRSSYRYCLPHCSFFEKNAF